jgi:mycoredoxin
MAEIKTITLYGTTWCYDCTKARRQLDELKIEYEFVNIDNNARAADYVRSVNHGNRSVPTIVFPDGKILVEPSNGELAEKLQELGLTG